MARTTMHEVVGEVNEDPSVLSDSVAVRVSESGRNSLLLGERGPGQRSPCSS
jgi:hypothetical protein